MTQSNEIIISIKPKWWELIKSGKKLDEIRKTRPGEARNKPFYRVYFYLTGGGGIVGGCIVRHFRYIQAGIDEVGTRHLYNTFGLRHCLDDEALFNYLYREVPPEKPYPGGWAWHIEYLAVFDKPMKIERFGLKRPPQSWQYV